MPAFLEAKLKNEYGAHSAVPFKVMNAMGAMHGNRETAKGRSMARKHESDMARGKSVSVASMMKRAM